MQYNLSIQSEDYGFIKEAIKLRTMYLLDSIEKQVTKQIVQSTMSEEAFGPCSAASAPVKAEGAPVTIIKKDVKKKLHWTQTPEGKKKMAARKRKGTK